MPKLKARQIDVFWCPNAGGAAARGLLMTPRALKIAVVLLSYCGIWVAGVWLQNLPGLLVSAVIYAIAIFMPPRPGRL